MANSQATMQFCVYHKHKSSSSFLVAPLWDIIHLAVLLSAERLIGAGAVGAAVSGGSAGGAHRLPAMVIAVGALALH